VGESLESHPGESVRGELGLDEGIGHFGNGREGLRCDGDSSDGHLKDQGRRTDKVKQKRFRCVERERKVTDVILVDGSR